MTTWRSSWPLRWRGVAADVAINRDAAGYQVSVTPKGGTLPLELRQRVPPGPAGSGEGRRLASKAGWQGQPDDDVFWRFDRIAAPVTFRLPVPPGPEVVVVSPPLALGDPSSRLRIIRTWMEGQTFKLMVEGRRGATYRLRVLTPAPIVSLDGAVAPRTPTGTPVAGRRAHELQITMVPAEAGAPGASTGQAAAASRQRDWATHVVSIVLGR